MSIGPPEETVRYSEANFADLAVVRGFGGQFASQTFVKRFQPGAAAPDDVLTPPRQLFIDTARVLKRMSDAGAAHWAPVQSVTETGPAPCYVTPHYPNSAQRLIGRADVLDPRALHHIVEGVVGGLVELKHLCRRAHGNLKPSNILIAGQDDLAEAQVALTDPAAGDRLVIDGGEINDLFELGQLIHQLVLHRPFRTGDTWPLPPSAEWRSLGRKAQAWRALCSRLLNPDSPQGAAKLEDVEACLPRLRWVKTSSVGRWAVLLALLVLVAGGAGAFIYVQSSEEWTTRSLIREAQPRLSALQTRQAVFEQRHWTGPAGYLGQVHARVSSAHGPELQAALAELARAEELSVRVERQWMVVEENRRCVDLTGDSILKTYNAFVESEIKDSTSAPGVESLSRLAASLDKIVSDRAWADVVAFLRSPKAAQLDLPYFVEASTIHKQFAGNAMPTAGDLRAWLAEASSDQFLRLVAEADPRLKWRGAETLASLRSGELARLRELYHDDPAAMPVVTLASSVDTIEAEIKALDRAALPWTRPNVDAVTRGVHEVDTALRQIKGHIESAISAKQAEIAAANAQRTAEKLREEALAYARICEDATLDATPEIAAIWQSRNKELARSIRDDVTRYGEPLKQRRQALQDVLLALDSEYQGLPAKPRLTSGPGEWNKPLSARLEEMGGAQRQKVLADALPLVSGKDGMSADELKAAWPRWSAGYLAWCAEAQSMVADLNAVEGLLGSGYALTEKPYPDAKTPRELLAGAQAKAAYKDDGVQKALAPFMSSLVALDKADAKRLIEEASADTSPLGLRLSAWQALCAQGAPGWPAGKADLDQSVAIAASLGQAIEKRVTDELRLKARQADLRKSVRDCWVGFMLRAATSEDVEHGISVRTKFGIADGDDLDPRIAFNMLLHDFRESLPQTNAEAAKEQAARQIGVRLVKTAGALPQALRDQPQMAALIAAVKRLEAADPAEDAARLGPLAPRAKAAGLIDWKPQYDAKTQTIRYTAQLPVQISHDELELVFKRVTPESGPPFYLCTTAVSVGLFMDVLAATNEAPAAAKVMWIFDPRQIDPRVGPRVWDWAAGGKSLRRTVLWLSGNFDHYPRELATADNRMVLAGPDGAAARDLNPSKKQPMQQVSVEAALFFADLLGCRLQTPAEWKAAYKASGARLASANLRDHAWKLQYDWIQKSGLDARCRPDAGMFIPAGEKPSAEVWTEARLSGANAPGGREYSDGALWFREVASGSTDEFNHLVGNVAQYAVDEAGKAYVIGASALSPPGRAVDQEYELPDAAARPKGYSDVGFRLAFSLPPRGIDQVRVAVKGQPYLMAQ